MGARTSLSTYSIDRERRRERARARNQTYVLKLMLAILGLQLKELRVSIARPYTRAYE